MIDQMSSDLAKRLLDVFLKRRRMLPTDSCQQHPCDECYAVHLAKLQHFTSCQQPIHFVLPAFPAKSANKVKVLGHLPDLAEQVSLNFLQDCCRRIQTVYAPGARITICSDGRVFSDLVGVSETNVSKYGEELKFMINNLGDSTLDTFSLDDVFETHDHEQKRQRLLACYGTSLEELREQIKDGTSLLHTFNGISRFIFEDLIMQKKFSASRNKIRLEAKELAYKVVQRSQAWSAMVADEFPNAIRLSIHTQPCHSEKIGIYLVETQDNWLTPWHGVAVDMGDQYVLMKRSQAERLGASLVRRNGSLSHYKVSKAIDYQENLLCLQQQTSV